MATLLTQETFPNNELKQTYKYTSTLLIIRYYLALKRASSFIGQIEFHLSKKFNLCVKFGWNKAIGSEEKDFQML